MTAGICQDVEGAVREHWRLVNKIAKQMSRRFPRSVELDDLKAAGRVGLLKGLATYEEGKGTTIDTWLSNRIRWAILDELRAADWVSRTARQAEERPTTMVNLGPEEHEEDRPLAIAWSNEMAPSERVENRDLWSWALNQLDAREETVVTLYFEHDLTLKEIAKIMQLTESRICRIKLDAITKIQDAAKEGNGRVF